MEGHGYGDSCQDITPRIVREFIADSQQNYAPKTIANNIRALKTLFNLGINEELIEVNPLRRVSVPKVPDRGVTVLTPADIEALLRACNRETLTGLRDAVMILVLFDCGLRASELVRLKEEDINWQQGTITAFGKGSKARGVPVSPKTLRAVRRYIHKRNRAGFSEVPAVFVNHEGQALSASGLLQMFERLSKRTGVRVHPHALRHSYAVNALNNGASLIHIQTTLGHTSLDMSRIYLRQSLTDLSEAHKRFSPADRLRFRV